MKPKGTSVASLNSWFRRAVLANCNYTCAVCGNKWPASELEAHHLIGRHYRALRYDWRNGVAVCRGACHSIADERSGTAAILRGWPHAQYLEDMVKVYRTYRAYYQAVGVTEKAHTVCQLIELKEIARRAEN